MSVRVVVTGMGVVSPVGIGLDPYWEALVNGRSGVGLITRFDTSEFTTKIAAQICDFDPNEYIDRKEARRMDRFAQYAVVAAMMALKDSGLSIEGSYAEDVGVLIGSGIGGMETYESQVRILVEKGPSRVSPFLVPMMIPDMASGQVSILTGAKGPNATTVTACASATHSIGDAFKIIQRGDARAMITGGAEAPITPVGLAGFQAARTLSTNNENPQGASRPFDQKRDGFVMGEGAGILILERLDDALARNARIYAEVVGYGASGDAYHITSPAPEGEGAARALRRCLADAKARPEDVGYINAHGTSTAYNDLLETQAIKSVFGKETKIPVSSTKSIMGHLLGAAGAVEAIATILALTHQILPPTINLQTPDPECDLDYVPNTARPHAFNLAMSNSFGFGGHNAVLAFRTLEG